MIRCPKCGIEYGVGQFPFCKGGHGTYNVNVIGDDIPGGMTIENLGPTPETFYTRTAWKRRMAELGVINRVEHKPLQGTDKSPHTTRWV